MMTTTKSESGQIAEFICDYAARLAGCGATCARVERNVGRIAGVYGCEVDLSIMPMHVQLSFTHAPEEPVVQMTRPIEGTIDFTVNSALSALSWRIADEHPDITEAQRRFERITAPRRSARMVTVALMALAMASFCRLFGGDAGAMTIVAASTVAGVNIRQLMHSLKIDPRVVFFVSSFIASVICSGATRLWPGDTPEIARATCVLYLIPGVPYLNAAADLIARHYICAMSRLLDAIALTAALSAGLVAGLRIFNIADL